MAKSNQDRILKVSEDESFFFTKIPTKMLKATYACEEKESEQIIENNMTFNELTIVLMNMLYRVVVLSSNIPDKKVDKLQRILDEIISKGYCKEHPTRSVEHKIHKLLQII